jgi:gluconolactonase
MRPRTRSAALLAMAAVSLFVPTAGAQVTADAPLGRPQAVVDLRTREGARLVRGEWRYSDVQLVEVAHRAPGPDLRPSGPPIRTYDIAPHAGGADFDDSRWETIDPAALDGRRGTGRLSFNWYRIKVTIPERLGSYDPTGATVVFETVVDDYAEVWVEGKLPLVLGQTGGPVAKGFNAPNRVVLTRSARPGQQIQLAVFGANGPLSSPPGNFIWVRSATLDFYKDATPHTPAVRAVALAKGEALRDAITDTAAGKIVRHDPALAAIVPPDARIEKLAGGFTFVEGPVWVRDGTPSGGYLLFSDPNENVIYRWSPDGQVSVFRTKSGYAGVDIGEYTQPGSNGLTLDREGRLTINEHGNRRVTRLEKNGVLTVLADRYEGRRLNSPNDLVYRSDGALYFSDPPFGLPTAYDDPRKELPYSGVFMLKDGRLRLLAQDLKGPNGLAFSPDERFLYVGNWDPERKVVMRYPVRPDGTLGAGTIFFDMTSAEGEDALDGLKVDRQGNVYASGPGGLWIISPTGTHLGTVVAPEHPHNIAWGDEDGRTLYMAARTGLYRLRLGIPGIRP